MFKTHPYIYPPENQNAKIWRFISIPKLLSLLENSSLYFTRADEFTDPFEGHYAYNYLSRLQGFLPGNLTKVELNKIYSIFLEMRVHTYLNCWHLNDYESAAMWDIYQRNNDAIAIQSTYTKLCNSLIQKEPDVFVGKV
jgi:hypothetical protein